MRRDDPFPDADFDLLRTGYKEICAEIADLEGHGADERPRAEQVMARFARGLHQNRDGLLEANAMATAHLAALRQQIAG